MILDCAMDLLLLLLGGSVLGLETGVLQDRGGLRFEPRDFSVQQLCLLLRCGRVRVIILLQMVRFNVRARPRLP